ncbi:MAG: GNAT family N-acetyltransferase [Terricaulis sp.]
MSVAVRVLTARDLTAFRALHRFALAHAPDAFAETSAMDATRTDTDTAAMLARGETWGAFVDGRLVGKLAIDAPPYDAFTHTRWLHGVYVHPDARGTGAAGALVDGALAAAKSEGAFIALLWVNEKNASARKFYQRLGFREVGRIAQGIAVAGAYVDDVMMQKELG